ncbi:hypothetical protein ACVWZA_002411 [Sphingomonas sp. UYAg733]
MIKTMWLAMAAIGWSMAGTASAQAPTGDGFDALVGGWTCDGYFVKSGKKVASVLDISRDVASRALIVRHDKCPRCRNLLVRFHFLLVDVRRLMAVIDRERKNVASCIRDVAFSSMLI